MTGSSPKQNMLYQIRTPPRHYQSIKGGFLCSMHILKAYFRPFILLPLYFYPHTILSPIYHFASQQHPLSVPLCPRMQSFLSKSTGNFSDKPFPATCSFLRFLFSIRFLDAPTVRPDSLKCPNRLCSHAT